MYFIVKAIAKTHLGKFPILFNVTDAKLLLSETASPNFKSSWCGFIEEAHLLKARGLVEPIRDILNYYGAIDLDLLIRACLARRVVVPDAPSPQACISQKPQLCD
jgi:hypothetical protein